jgi:hypothetical protein
MSNTYQTTNYMRIRELKSETYLFGLSLSFGSASSFSSLGQRDLLIIGIQHFFILNFCLSLLAWLGALCIVGLRLPICFGARKTWSSEFFQKFSKGFAYTLKTNCMVSTLLEWR